MAMPNGAGVDDELFLLNNQYEKDSPFSSNNSASPLSLSKENYQDQSSLTHNNNNPVDYTNNNAPVSSTTPNNDISDSRANLYSTKPIKGTLGSGKITKRRSRAANKKAPIAMHSTDASNFRDMVQKLTGIPLSNTSVQHYNGSMPFFKPNPNRIPMTSNGGNNLHQLPTLDTSVSFLGSINGPPSNNHFQNLSLLQRASQKPSLYGSSSSFLGPNGEVSELGLERRSTTNFSSTRNPPFDIKSLPDHQHMIPPMGSYNQSSSSSSSSSTISPSSLPHLWNTLENERAKVNYPTYIGQGIISESAEGLISSRQASTLPLDNFKMLEEMQGKSSYNPDDVWFAYDGSIVNNSPTVGLTRTS